MKKKRGRPPSRLPRRYKGAGGKFTGSYFVRIEGRDVNLRTKDAAIALARSKEAYKGKRDFVDDSGGTAAKVVADAVVGTDAAQTAPVVEPPRAAAPPPTFPAHTPAAALPPIPANPTASQQTPPPITPDEVISPPPPSQGWAAALGAAAQESASSSGAGASSDGDDVEDTITPEMIDEAIDEATAYAVGLQLWAQAWLGAHMKPVAGVNVKVAPVPENAKGIAVGRRLWKKAFKKLAARYLPSLDIPPWIAAPMMVASMTLPIQFGPGCEVMPDDPTSREETTPGASAPVAAAA